MPRAVPCQPGSTMAEFLHLLSGQMGEPQLLMQQDSDGGSSQADVSGPRMISVWLIVNSLCACFIGRDGHRFDSHVSGMISLV